MDRIVRSLAFIEDRLGERFEAGDVAAAAGLSPWHYARVFQALTGETVMGYVRKRRLTEAARRLADGDTVRLIELALDSGFESQAAFTIDEVLRGEDVTVLGVTDQVAGQIIIDFENPAASQLGLIQVNARTFATDNENRNRAIRNEVLDVSEFEFISFAPTSLENLPEQVAFGDEVSFVIVGDLTIRHVTREVRFTATLLFESAERVQGRASATIQRADFELTIPQVPAVASVSESVGLALDFVAVAQ